MMTFLDSKRSAKLSRKNGEGRIALVTALAVILIACVGAFLFWSSMRLKREREAAQLALERSQEDQRLALVAAQAPEKRAARSPAPEKPSEAPKPVAEPAEAAPKAEGGAVEGAVKVAGTEKPAAGVLVIARQASDAAEEMPMVAMFEGLKSKKSDKTAEAGAGGEYRIDGLPDGAYRIFVSSGKSDFVPLPPSKGTKVAIEPEARAHKVDLEVVQGGAIHGKVLDQEDKPLEGIHVTSMPRDFFSSVLDPEKAAGGISETKSEKDGSYRLRGLALGKGVVVRTQGSHRANIASQELTPTTEEPVIRLDIVLFPGSRIEGRVVDAEASPVEGATILALNLESGLDLAGMGFSPGTKSDAEGKFRTDPVGAGKHTVRATRFDGQDANKDVECDGETDVTGIVLVFEPKAAPSAESSVAGRVVDDTGAPISGVEVKLSGFSFESGPKNASTTSAEDGSFRFEGLSVGTFNLNADRDGHSPFFRTGLMPGADPVEVVLSRMASVRGQVVARKGGEPIGGASIKLSSADGGTSDIAQRITAQMMRMMKGGGAIKTADDGTFLAEKVSPGRYRVRAEASGFGPGYSAEFDVAPGGQTQAPKSSLGAGSSVAGRVVGPDGKAAPGSQVRVQEITGDKMEAMLQRMMPGMLGGAGGPTTTSGEDGEFSIEHLPQGKLVFAASHEKFAPGEEEVTLGQDEARAGVQLRLRTPASIRVVVLEREKPLPGYMVQLIGTGPMKMSTTAADGMSLFEGVGPGRYMLNIMNLAAATKGGAEMMNTMRQRSVRVEEGQQTEMRVVFGAGAKIQGKVTGAPPNVQTMITLRRPGGPSADELDPLDMESAIAATEFSAGLGIMQKDGTFTVADLADGEYIIEVHRADAVMASGGPTTPESRKPMYQHTVKVEGGKDLEWNIEIKGIGGEPKKE